MIIVDDLDRCVSSMAYRLLEDIKIHFNVNNCVFVLGMNQDVIEDAILELMPGAQPGEGQGARVRAREYLEKICHDIRHLDVIRDRMKLLGDYCQAFMPKKHAPFWKTEISALQKELEKSGVGGLFPSNPRKIKSYANVLRQFDDVLYADWITSPKNAEDKQRRARLVLLFAYLYHFHFKIYQQFQQDAGFHEEFDRWLKNPKAEDAHTVFKGLKTASIPVDPGKGAKPGDEDVRQIYHDPDDPESFYIQPLLKLIGAITPEEIKACTVL